MSGFGFLNSSTKSVKEQQISYFFLLIKLFLITILLEDIGMFFYYLHVLLQLVDFLSHVGLAVPNLGDPGVHLTQLPQKVINALAYNDF